MIQRPFNCPKGSIWLKGLLLAGLALPVAGSVTAQHNDPSYKVTGHLTGLTAEKKVFLSYRTDKDLFRDSAVTEKGSFSFKGKLTGPASEPVKADIELKALDDDGIMTVEKYMKRDVQTFFLEKGATKIAGTNTIKTASITGGKTQQEYLSLQAQLKPLQDEMAPLSEKARALQAAGNKEAMEQLFPSIRAIREKMNKVEDDFISAHPGSYVSLDMVAGKGVIIEPEKFEPFYNALTPALRQSAIGKKLGERLAIAKKTAIGKTAIPFTQHDTAGVPVSLASLKGKYVLIDFWASWCGPCRAENPNVVKAYRQFKDKNFEIIGVSLDEQKDAWLKAIKDDGLPWIHVSDLKGWKNRVAVDYGISAVPQNLLLDPDGIIIAKNLRGEALEKKLGEVIGAAAAGNAVIKVKMKNAERYPMFFSYQNNQQQYVFDSAFVEENGYRVYTLPVTGFRLQPLIVRNPAMNIPLKGGAIIPGPFLKFLIRPGATVTIEGDAEDPLQAVVKSDDAEIQAFETYRSKDKILETESWNLTRKRFEQQGDAALDGRIQAIGKGREEWKKEFVKKYPGAYAALEVFSTYYTLMDIREATRIFDSLPGTYKHTALAQTIKTQLAAVAVTAPGKPVIPFRQEGIDGNAVDIAALKGKVVLIDFWGSWCGPCRQSHPHLKALYDKYKSKGLEIVGVASEAGSREKQEEAWKKAVKEDGMSWPQVLNDRDKEDIVKSYGITAFPTKVLVSRDGTILFRHIGSEPGELDQQLRDIFRN